MGIKTVEEVQRKMFSYRDLIEKMIDVICEKVDASEAIVLLLAKGCSRTELEEFFFKEDIEFATDELLKRIQEN